MKKQINTWFVAAIYYIAAFIIPHIIAIEIGHFLPETKITQFFGSWILPIIIIMGGAWFGAYYINKYYIINNAKKIIKSVLIYMLIFNILFPILTVAANELYNPFWFMANMTEYILNKYFLPLIFNATLLIVFYLATAKFIKNNTSQTKNLISETNK